MEGLDSYVILLIVYAGLALLKKFGGRGQGARTRTVPAGEPKRAPSTMEELLREMQGELGVEEREEEWVEAPSAPVPYSAPGKQGSWDVEDRESLEVEANVYVRPEIERPAPVVIDRDDDALAIANHRVAVAQARNRAWAPEDHQKFDVAIRRVAPEKRLDHSRARALRQAIIWREVLDKPIALRD